MRTRVKESPLAFLSTVSRAEASDVLQSVNQWLADDGGANQEKPTLTGLIISDLRIALLEACTHTADSADEVDFEMPLLTAGYIGFLIEQNEMILPAPWHEQMNKAIKDSLSVEAWTGLQAIYSRLDQSEISWVYLRWVTHIFGNTRRSLDQYIQHIDKFNSSDAKERRKHLTSESDIDYSCFRLICEQMMEDQNEQDLFLDEIIDEIQWIIHYEQHTA